MKLPRVLEEMNGIKEQVNSGCGSGQEERASLRAGGGGCEGAL